ncbi:MAG TPA: hypothetical protein VE871_18435 [Longimicrobium sp.]|nr:hypothetical protein [Longimicrobium sp.]
MTTTTTEATLGQHGDGATLDLDPAPSASAALVLTAGDAAPDRAEGTPTHGWPGSLFIFLAHLSAFGLGAGAAIAAVLLVSMLFGGDLEMAGLAGLAAVGMGIGSYVQRTLADHLSHFSRWGWWGAMAELAAVTLTKVAALVTDPASIGGTGIGIVIDLLWLRYFWEHRADFDIDIDL